MTSLISPMPHISPPSGAPKKPLPMPGNRPPMMGSKERKMERRKRREMNRDDDGDRGDKGRGGFRKDPMNTMTKPAMPKAPLPAKPVAKPAVLPPSAKGPAAVAKPAVAAPAVAKPPVAKPAVVAPAAKAAGALGIKKTAAPMKKGGEVKKMASGGMTSSASKRADGCAVKGKTKGKYL